MCLLQLASKATQVPVVISSSISPYLGITPCRTKREMMQNRKKHASCGCNSSTRANLFVTPQKPTE